MLDKKTRDALVMSVYYYCVQQAGRYSNYRYEHADALQDALQGAIEAAEKFEPERGLKFLTFAHSYIKRGIMDGIYKNMTSMKVPSSGIGHKYYTAMNDAATRGVEGAAELHNMPAGSLQSYIDARKCMPDIEGMRDTMPDTRAATEQSAIDNDMRKSIRAAMWSLKDQEKLYIIEYYFNGLNMPEIAKKYGMSRQNIAHIIKLALGKLRARAWHLRDFIDG